MSINMNERDVSHVQPEARNPEVTYDTTDLSSRGVLMFMVLLAVGAVLITGSLWGLYKYIAGDRILATPSGNPMITSRRETKEPGGDPALRFPAPRLQADPVADFNKFRAQEEEILNSYGWVDEANNKVHIPVEAAIDLISQAGLPVRPETLAPGGAQGGVTAAKVAP